MIEIPQTVRFDLVLILIGVGLIILPFYGGFLNTEREIPTILIIIGSIVAIFGIGYTKQDYEIDIDLKDTRHKKYT